MTVLDHIVIVAASLPEGLDYCEAQLGVRPPKGGEHPRMGTHNHLLKLGAGVFLEVIAINPAADAPAGPRWFGMDSPQQRTRCANGPYPATFVVRTKNIAATANRLPEVGAVQDMTRGVLQWKITIPEDGLLVEGGTLPSLIEWPESVEPTDFMPDAGYRLLRLEAHHPQPQVLRRKWDLIGLADDRLSIRACGSEAAPYLVAVIDTPAGRKTISGKA
ncbi:MAG TPA: VOC family protein [Paucimonas sp.]|nr:VOC family protein [Paucimonas sp.]